MDLVPKIQNIDALQQRGAASVPLFFFTFKQNEARGTYNMNTYNELLIVKVR